MCVMVGVWCVEWGASLSMSGSGIVHVGSARATTLIQDGEHERSIRFGKFNQDNTNNGEL